MAENEEEKQEGPFGPNVPNTACIYWIAGLVIVLTLLGIRCKETKMRCYTDGEGKRHCYTYQEE